MNVFVIHTLPPLLLGLLAKSVCLLLAAWVVCLVLRRASAATRHLVWSSALIGLLLLPLLTIGLPHWNLALRHAPPAAVSRPTPPASAVTALPMLSTAPAPVMTPPVSPGVPFAPRLKLAPSPLPLSPLPTPQHSPIAWQTVLTVTGLTIWLLGVMATLVRLVIGLRRVEVIKQRAVPLDDATQTLAASLRERMGLRRPVAFLRAGSGSGVSIPLTWGGRRPTVLLPEQSDTWPEANCRAAWPAPCTGSTRLFGWPRGRGGPKASAPATTACWRRACRQRTMPSVW